MSKNKYDKKNYYANPKRKKQLIESNARLRKKRKAKLLEMFGNKCSICGYDTCIAALCFHHLDPNEKQFTLSQRHLGMSWERIEEEAKKCILVCANCHMEIEHGELTEW